MCSTAARGVHALRMDPSKGCQVANDAVVLKIFHVFLLFLLFHYALNVRVRKVLVH